MERSPDDDDNNESNTAGMPSAPAESPWAKLMGVRSEAMFTPPPRIERAETPPPPPLSPTILRIEHAAAPPPPQEFAPYPDPGFIPEASSGETADDDEAEEDEDDTLITTPRPVRHDLSHAPIDVEWPSYTASEAVAPPLVSQARPPLPVYEAHYDNAPVVDNEPWRPPASPMAAVPQPSQPAEFAFFDRHTSDAPETPTAIPATPSTEASWQRPQYYHPPVTAEYAAPASSEQAEAPQYSNYAQAEIRRLHNARAADVLVTIAVAGWMNHNHNKQHRQEQQALQELQQEHTQQAQENYRLKHQVAAQGQHLEQLSYAQQHMRSEQQVTPEQAVQRLHERAALAEQAVAEQATAEGVPRQHVEHTWYNEVFDAEGKVVAGAVEHGRAYHEERRAETGVYHSTQQASTTPSSNPYSDGAFPLPPVPADPRLPSGQVDSSHSLPNGQPDMHHLLEEPHKSLKKAVTSNAWIWVGLAILLFAFFSAAFI